MKWISHLGLTWALTAPLAPSPLVLFGAVAPDWLETFGPFRHRQDTHVLLYWALLLGLSLPLLWSGQTWAGHLFWFAVGGLLHCLEDALTPQGVPLSPRASYRITLFGGRVRTGEPAEFVLVGLALFLSLVFFGWGVTKAPGTRLSCFFQRAKWCEAGRERIRIGEEEVFLAAPAEVKRHRFDW